MKDDQLSLFDLSLQNENLRGIGDIASVSKVTPLDTRYRNGRGELLPWELPEGESYED